MPLPTFAIIAATGTPRPVPSGWFDRHDDGVLAEKRVLSSQAIAPSRKADSFEWEDGCARELTTARTRANKAAFYWRICLEVHHLYYAIHFGPLPVLILLHSIVKTGLFPSLRCTGNLLGLAYRFFLACTFDETLSLILFSHCLEIFRPSTPLF